MSSDIRVRYAPSPTGHLHIGNARTALFNYLSHGTEAESSLSALKIQIKNAISKAESKAN